MYECVTPCTSPLNCGRISRDIAGSIHTSILSEPFATIQNELLVAGAVAPSR